MAVPDRTTVQRLLEEADLPDGIRVHAVQVSRASPWPVRASWRRQASRSTAGWSRRRRCSMTSTSPRSGGRAVSTGSSARDGSRRRGLRVARHAGRLPPAARAAQRRALPDRLAIGPGGRGRPARGAGVPDGRRAPGRHEAAASRARRVHRDRRGARPHALEAQLAEATGGLATDALVERLRAAWEAGASAPTPLVLLHGDDGFGLDLAMRELTAEFGGCDRSGGDHPRAIAG